MEFCSSAVLQGFDSLTVLVKNHIAFPKYGLKRSEDTLVNYILDDGKVTSHTVIL